MIPTKAAEVEIPAGLLESLENFPAAREIHHCGQSFSVSSFDFYTACPHCGKTIKLRAFSGCAEIEDLFDAVFTWMNRNGNPEVARRRMAEIAADSEES